MAEISEADILRQLDAAGLGTTEVYQDFITELGNEIANDFREYLDTKTKSTGRHTKIYAKPSQNGFVIEADYWYDFIDQGVNAAPKQEGLKYTRPLVQNSPYSFKHLGVGSNMERSIAEWSGASIGQAYGIAISIKKHGIQPKNITEGVITPELLEKISTDLGKITGLMITATFKKHGAK